SFTGDSPAAYSHFLFSEGKIASRFRHGCYVSRVFSSFSSSRLFRLSNCTSNTRSTTTEMGEGTTLMAIDPVCGMEVDEKDAKDPSSFEGKTFYFCSTDCREEFDEAPEDYVGDDLRTGTA